MSRIPVIVCLSLGSSVVACGGAETGGHSPVVVVNPVMEAFPGRPALLACQARDVDGKVESVAWTQTAGEPVTLADADGYVARFEAPAPDEDLELSFQVEVIDDEGLIGSADVVVTVLANAAPLLVVSGPDLVDVGEEVTLSASASDDSGPLPEVTWTQTAGGPVTLTLDGNQASFVVPPTRLGEDLAFTATARDGLGAETSASLAMHARGNIDADIEAVLDDIVLVDFGVVRPDGFLFTDEPGAGVYRWQRGDAGPARNITANIARFLALAGYVDLAAVGFEDMVLRTSADPTSEANMSGGDLGVFLFAHDLLGEQDYLDVAAAMFDTATVKYTFDDSFPRSLPGYPGLWAYDAQYSLHGWFLADQAGITGAAAELATRRTWYEDRYAAQVKADPFNAVFTNLIADWYGIGARTTVQLDVEELGFQYTAFALMGNTVDPDVAAEYLLEHLHDDTLVSEEVAEGAYALALYLER